MIHEPSSRSDDVPAVFAAWLPEPVFVTGLSRTCKLKADVVQGLSVQLPSPAGNIPYASISHYFVRKGSGIVADVHQQSLLLR